MKTAVAVLFAVLGASCCLAETVPNWAEAQKNKIYYDNEGSGGWNDPTRWVGGKVPGPQNAVYVENASGVVIRDSDLNVFTNVFWYRFDRSHITLDCEADVKFPGCIRSGGRSKFVKVGANRLDFVPSHDTYCNYSVTDFIVSNGWVRFGRLYEYERLMPLIEVWKPGVVELDPNLSTKVLGLVGDGVVTNTQAKVAYLRTYSRLTGGQFGYGPWTFSGTAVGPVKICISDEGSADDRWGEQWFMGTNNIRIAKSDNFLQIFRGFVGVEEPGLGNGNPASIAGSCCQFYGAQTTSFSETGFRYLGKGGATDVRFDYYNRYGTSPLVIDAGPHGGLTFMRKDGVDASDYSGEWRNVTHVHCISSKWDTSVARYTDVTGGRIVLTGSNVNACVISNYVHETGDVTYMCFIKRGTGTWRFADRDSEWCQNRGPVLVEQGRLEFDSFTALGTASRQCTNFWEGVGDDRARVQYIYRIGNGTNDAYAADLATMAYLGSSKESSSRKFAVCGAGRLENAGGGLELTGGVFSDAEGGNTLVLAGPGENRFTHVTNGIGTLSVVKEDDGEWELLGQVRLDSAYVREGVLKFDGPSECPGLRVDGGASFIAETSDLAVNRLTADAGKGIGSVKGAVFAENGEFELLGAGEGFSSVELGGDFSGSTGLSNVFGWTLLVNGEPDTKHVVSISSGGLKVCRRGIKIVIR